MKNFQSAPTDIKLASLNEIGHVVPDSSGLKVFGEREWIEARTGKTYQRKIWRKIYIAIGKEGTILDLQMTNHISSFNKPLT